MKKTKLTHFLVTSLLSVTMLAGCGGAPSSEPEAIVEFITVNLPQTAVIGDKLNLDDYVEVQALVGDGSKYTYTVDLMGSDVASYDAKTKELTITDEGMLNIKVSCGGQEAYGEMETLTAYRDSYRQFTEDVVNNYFVGLIGSDQSGNMTLTSDGFISNDNYCATPMFFFGYEQAYQGYTTTKNGNCYSFTADDSVGTNLNVMPGKLFDITSGIGQRIMPFTMSYDLFETQVDSYGDEVLVGGYEAAAALGEMIGMRTVTDMASGNPITDDQGNVLIDGNCTDQILMFLDEYPLQDGSTLMLPSLMWLILDTKPNDANGNLTSLFAPFYLSVDPSFASIPALDAYIEAGTEPETIGTDAMQSVVSKIAELKNYTVDTFIGWTDDNGTPTDPHPLWIEYGWGQPGFLDYETSSTTYLTETTYYSESAAGEIMAYVPNAEGTIIQYSNYDSETMKTAPQTWSSIWEGHPGLINRLTKPGVFENANIAMYQTDGTTSSYMALGQAGGDKFLVELFNCIPVYGGGIAQIVDMQATVTGNTAAQIMFNAYITASDEMLVIDLTVEWTTNATYHFQQYYHNFGTTVIPQEKLDALQPAA